MKQPFRPGGFFFCFETQIQKDGRSAFQTPDFSANERLGAGFISPNR